MNPKELIASYIATCKCCLLSEAMKDCPKCCFNIGLGKQVKQADPIPVAMPVQVAVFEMAE